ncbi:hypothetical protein D0Z00_000705 [Geotrichum galactomycetum]|uniref:Uncharacterized protein n=1 Tax=Geotrichum galactomycetum TaxID=27317 RepID=A0ACB6V997_9ASCO|nr:hypothetical protein D0Z00_000705 [Geotrichum candidum]
MASLSSPPANNSSNSPNPGTFSENIKVSIRVKPSIANNHNDMKHRTIPRTTVDASWAIRDNQISSSEFGNFKFDHVFQTPQPTAYVFDTAVKDLVDQVMAGYNGMVFAYGMTGSGKTHSMQGSNADPGIIPLAVNSVFDYIGINSPPYTMFKIKVSYLEIYNEQLRDLLAPSTPADDIRIRDDPKRGVRAIGAKEIEVDTPEALLQVIQSGNNLRRTEGTEFNANSSRSHAVVQIIVESTSYPPESSVLPLSGHALPKNLGSALTRASTLYLCDLAGSERAASQTERRKEGAYINKSLLTLGTVISRLSLGGAASHIPYRDSKLTRLLQPALSGRSLVSVLCTVDFSNHTETVSTLRFAARAKNIMISAKRSTEDSVVSSPSAMSFELANANRLIEKLTNQMQTLKMENLALKTKASTGVNASANNSRPTSDGSVTSYTLQLKIENKILNERIEHLTRLFDDDHLDSLIGATVDDDQRLSPRAKDDESKRKESEYKAYIAQLEKQVYEQSVRLRTSSVGSGSVSPTSTFFPNAKFSHINNGGNNNNNNSISGAGTTTPGSHFNANSNYVLGKSPISSSSPPNAFPSSTQQYYAEMVAQLKEEVDDLKESNSDKDRIISKLKHVNKRKENLTAKPLPPLTINTHSASTAHIESPVHSPAYLRYYYASSNNSPNILVQPLKPAVDEPFIF